MDFSINGTTGLYTVTLGGEVWTNCTKDTDCPGRALCALNQTWTAFPTMCVCLNSVGHSGAACETINSLGAFFYAANIIACMIATVATFVGLLALFRMIQWKRCATDALSTSLVFSVLGCLWTAIETGSSTRYAHQVITPDALGSKTDKSRIGPVSLAFSFLFSTLAMLNVSLVWIEIAMNAERVQKSQSHNVERYRNALIVYYVFFMGMIGLALGINNFIFAAAMSVPGVIFIIVTYVIGFVKMKKMLVNYLSSDGMGSGSMAAGSTSNKDAVRKLRDSLRAIEHTALGVSLSALGFIIFMGLWVIGGGFDPRPGRTLNIVSIGLAWISVAIANAFVMWYVYNAVVRKGPSAGAVTANAAIVSKDYMSQSENPLRNTTTAANKSSQNARKVDDMSVDQSATDHKPADDMSVDHSATDPKPADD